jgi:hypothetical protein
MRIIISTANGDVADCYEIDPNAIPAGDVGQRIEDALGAAGLCDCDDCGRWVASKTMREFPDGVLVCRACAVERAEESASA